MPHVLAVLLIVTLAVIGLWDVYVSYLDRPHDTVSDVLNRWSTQWPVIPLHIGLVLGHILWRR
jgi:hypothetical protein